MLNILAIVVGIVFGFVVYALCNLAIRQFLRIDDFNYLVTLSDESLNKRISLLAELCYVAISIGIVAGATSVNMLTNILVK